MTSDPFDAWAHSPFRHAVPDLDALGPEDVFDPYAAYAHPGDLGAFGGRQRKRVCVIGGGVAGLTAAYELLKLGHDVVLLEASGRFGGRILTHYFADGTYGELGAMRIPEDHGCVLRYIEDFGLPTRKFVGKENEQGWCLFRDAPKMRRKDWDRDWSRWYAVSGKVSKRSSDAVVEDMVRAAQVMTAQDWWESLSNRLTTPRLRRLEATALGQHVLGVQGRIAPQLTDEAWEFVGRTTHNIWLERTALLHWRREGGVLTEGAKYEIEGGMDRLTRAFVASIGEMQPGALRLNARVLAVDVNESDVAVTWRQARREAVCADTFDYVICTTPAPATVQIRFSPELPAPKREALTNLSYIGAGKTIMRCSKRHWELIDHIYGGTSVTDRPNQQCWYPSDNAEPPDEENRDQVTSRLPLDLTRDMLDIEAPVIDRVAESPERSNEPGVFLAAYMWGTNAQRFASLGNAERDDLICRSVAELHDQNDAYLEDIVHFSWDEQVSPGGGAFAFFAPGEQRRYQAALCSPMPSADDPRVFFAGEHVGILHGWIQSSTQTALAAVIDVLAAP
jgi:monoamine oxidase